MPLVHLADMVQHAYRHGYAVGAFGVDNQQFLEGVLQAAENSRAPVVINLIESHFSDGAFELFAPAAVAAARRATVPVAVNFDHGSSWANAERAIAVGCNAVMVDTSLQPFSDNLQQTRDVVARAHACGVTVEGELGYVPGMEGACAEEYPGGLAYTSAVEAKAFVERTGVDCLAVSIGTVHGHMKGSPKLDYNRLAKIHETVSIPLVIHGGTGLADDQYRRIIAHGVAKINYHTGLVDAAARRLRENAKARHDVSYGTLLAGVSDAVREEVERCMRIWGCGGRAAEVLERCQPWREVEHVVLFAAADVAPQEDEAAAMLREGGESIRLIPGVRNVRAGRALQPDGKYHYCWLVTLASQAAVEVFQNHELQHAAVSKASLALASGWVAQDFVEIQSAA
jgi:fructose-bisphosphate aldolase class II